ncbi:hypothetical protein TST_0180 [Thermosulfidibacter takaii ABI70S6]|uniref:Uncharacterized protein n=1 Tax=Thermosulfidibacter takaii (strain DSM 17441 / JCM 13301 / NBRC 103674 / ABI70S6) TaxID=1298851 RepID=A0A0S3QRN7_THET7|nr:hypothetical protein [Thermosulfidibacter takaii]BAT70990.1 hypothetical protein TST_0180 [Thermosulfidibacter takaii ABI70S6]
MRAGRHLALLMLFVFFLSSASWAKLIPEAKTGFSKVTVQTKSGVEVRFGMNEIFHIDWAKNFDFYSDASDPILYSDPEGFVRDNFMFHQVYFPIDFVKKDQWKAHIVFSYKNSDFDQGKDANYSWDNGVDYDRWRVERASFDFKLNFLPFNAWLQVGHDSYVADYLLIYGDDDPGIRLYGNYDKFAFDIKYVRKSEQTDRADFGSDSNRDLVAVKLSYDFGKAFKPTLSFVYDRNGAMTNWQSLPKVSDAVANACLQAYQQCQLGNVAACQTVQTTCNGLKLANFTDLISGGQLPKYNSVPIENAGTWDVYYFGLASTGIIGPFRYFGEIVYQTGDVDLDGKGMLMPDGDYEDHFDVNAWAGMLFLATDLGYVFPKLGKFIVSFGGAYFSGDDDASDSDLNGYVGATEGSRFFPLTGFYTIPVHCGLQNPVIGTPTYAWNPSGWGVGPGVGGLAGQPVDVLSLGAHGDNPGLWTLMLTVDWYPTPKWELKAQVKYLRWVDTDPIETQLGDNKIGMFRVPYAVDEKEFDYHEDAAKSIDEEIGWEVNTFVNYEIYDGVNIQGGFSILFPGDGIDDVNKVLYGDDDSDPAWHARIGVRFLF